MSIEQRLTRLEASDQIRALKMRYAHLCDAGYPIDELEALFAPAAVWDGGDTFGRHEGWQQIAEFFASASKRVSWAMHYTVAGDIHVATDGLTATGNWFLWQPMTFDGAAVWLMARYSDQYEVVNGAWRITHLALDVQALTPIDRSWVSERVARPEGAAGGLHVSQSDQRSHEK